MIRLYPMYCGGYSYLNGFYLYVGRWAIAIKPPWRGGWFGNGSRWTSGWFDWIEEDKRLYGDILTSFHRVIQARDEQAPYV